MQALFIGTLTVLVLLATSQAVNAQNLPQENSCKAKAKQIATDAYRSCVADEKNAQVEQIKRNYQVKMLALKKYYEDQLKKLGGPSTTAAAAIPAEAPKAQETNSEPTIAPTAPVESAPIENTDVKAEESAKAVPAPEIEKSEMPADEIKEEAMMAEQEAKDQAIEDELKAELKGEMSPETIVQEKLPEPKVELKPIVAAPKPAMKTVKKETAKKPVAVAKPGSKKSAVLPVKKLAAKSMAPKLPRKKVQLTDDSVMDIPEPIPVNLKPGKI